MTRNAQEIENWICTKIADVLQVDPQEVDVRAPFSHVGLDSLQAFVLTGELVDWLGRDVSVTLLWEYPDIRSVSRYLGGETDDPPLDNLAGVVALNRSPVTGSPLYCICGVHLYQKLARRLEATRQVYGVFVPIEINLLDSARTRAGHVEYPSVSEIAKCYLDKIRAHQQDGPYFLAGVSFGGVLAFEIGRQLHAAGQSTALVAMFDPVLPRAYRIRPLRRSAYLLRRFFEIGPRRSGQMLKRRLGRESSPPVSTAREEDETGSASDVTDYRHRIYHAAMCAYQPEPFPASIVVFRATDRTLNGYRIDSHLGWDRRVTSKWQFCDAPGSHIGLLQEPHAAELARMLHPHLSVSNVS